MMEDQCLRCNNRLETGAICRKELRQSAVVTTCSHVLCKECVERTGFVGTKTNQRQCPVCTQPLPNIDDAAEMNLRPTEEYKLSVLCGLDPTTIMECASSALSFWNYQVLQETAYQQHLLLALGKKYTALNEEATKVVDEANAEIKGLQKRVEDMAEVNSKMQQKNVDLAETCRERGKKYADLRKGYDSLKKMVLQNNQNSISEEVAEQAMRNFAGNSGADLLDRSFAGRTGHDATTSAHPISMQQDLSRGDNRVFEQLHQRQGQGSGSHYSEESLRMPPPPRPHSEHGLSPINPQLQNRTPLPGAFRFPAERGRLSSTNNRGTPAQPFGLTASGHKHLSRSGGSNDVNHGRRNGLMGYGGISGGMKVGGAQTDAQIRQQSGYVPSRGYNHHHSGSAPNANASQYFWPR